MERDREIDSEVNGRHYFAIDLGANAGSGKRPSGTRHSFEGTGKGLAIRALKIELG